MSLTGKQTLGRIDMRRGQFIEVIVHPPSNNVGLGGRRLKGDRLHASQRGSPIELFGVRGNEVIPWDEPAMNPA